MSRLESNFRCPTCGGINSLNKYCSNSFHIPFIKKALTMSKEDSKPDIIKFMLGEDEFDGLWFGDIKSGSPFWWRKPLRNYRDFIEKELSELKNRNTDLEYQLAKAKAHLEGCKMIFDKLGYRETSNRIESFLSENK